MMTRRVGTGAIVVMPPAASIWVTAAVGAWGNRVLGTQSNCDLPDGDSGAFMTNTISRVAGATLALLVLGASWNVTTVQAQRGNSANVIITTFCEMGQVTQCGHTAARTECSREVHFDLGWLSRTFGFGLGAETCVQIGEKFLYKDFIQGRSSGACMVYSGVGVDALSVRPKFDDEPSDGNDYDSSSCS